MSWRARLEPAVRPILQSWWRVSRGVTLGVRGIVLREDGHIALVRHTYVRGWYLPGGGVERGEPARTALHRELAEEAGVAVTGPAELAGVYSNHGWFRGDHVVLYVVRHWEPCCSDSAGEIDDVGWFAPDALPEGTTPATRRRLEEFAGRLSVSDHW